MFMEPQWEPVTCFLFLVLGSSGLAGSTHWPWHWATLTCCMLHVSCFLFPVRSKEKKKKEIQVESNPQTLCSRSELLPLHQRWSLSKAVKMCVLDWPVSCFMFHVYGSPMIACYMFHVFLNFPLLFPLPLFQCFCLCECFSDKRFCLEKKKLREEEKISGPTLS